jgi:coenzyme F420-0:L-glutamate ligase/coenzyme F420-1:gamma-L-glutamate ligase
MFELQVTTFDGVPMVREGDDLAGLALDAAARHGVRYADGDILVLAQKIVSKAEGRLVRLADVVAGEEARTLAAATDKDPRLVQLILDESACVMRAKPGVIIVRHRLGHVGANAGIDQSNIEHEGGECALLLPRDPDASAARLHAALRAATGAHVAVLIADSLNRPWRLGTIGGAIGCAGFEVLDDRRGLTDIYGRELKVTMINRADSIAAFATLAMGETVERTPLALVRGFAPDAHHGRAADIMRPLADDLFQ